MNSKAILIAFLLALAFISLPIHRANALPTQLVTNPPSITKVPGDAGSAFYWGINITDVSLLYGFDINVTWSNALITFNSVSYTTELDAVWGTNPGTWSVLISSNGVNDGAGWYKIVAVSLSNTFTKDPGTQTLFTLKFDVVGQSTNHDRTTSLVFATNKLSDKDSNSIPNTTTGGTYTMTGTKPTVALGPTSLTRWINDSLGNFTTTLTMSNTFDVSGVEFELHFSTSLLACMKVDSWGDLGIGSVTIDQVAGKINGAVGPHAPLSGTHNIAIIMFKPSTNHVWKTSSISPWTNIQSGTIFYQKANLTYASDPTLHYVRLGINEINVGSDVAYTWSPIKGDVNLNGVVDIFDLSAVAGYYDVTPLNNPTQWSRAEPRYELTKISGEQIIDLFDLIVIASNFGATHP